MTLPATGYLQNAARTVAEMKTALEDTRDAVSTAPGLGARTELTIATGTVTPGVRDHGGQFTVDTEGDAASDDLDTITYTNLPTGSIIRVAAENSSRVVTLKHGNGSAGEMLMIDSVDFVLDALDKWMEFQRRSTSWVEVARSYGVDHADFRSHHQIPRQTGGDVLCPHEALVVKYVSAATADVDATALLLTDASGNQRRFGSVNLTLNIGGTVGLPLGLDTGVETISTWYHIWAIGTVGGTVSAVFSTSTSAPVLPSGYTYYGYVGAIYNDASGNFVSMTQYGPEVVRPSAQVLTNGIASALTSFAFTTIVPVTARLASGTFRVLSKNTSGGQHNGNLASDASGAGNLEILGQVSTAVDGTEVARVPFRLLMLTAQTLYYLAGTNDKINVMISGWRY